MNTKKNIIAIIPARGGSKRIPNKNIKEFKGKPMIAWTIEAANNTNLFDEVVVSTDSKEISRISKKYGAKVPFLRNKYADAESPISLATLYALRQSEKYFKKKYNKVIQLMPNTPLKTSEDIIVMNDFFNKRKEKSVISCFKFGWMNPWWATLLDENNKPKMIFQDKICNRSQDLPDLYCPSGAIWISETNELKKYETFYSPEHIFYELDWKKMVDIDNYEDLEFAKVLFEM